MLKVGGGGGVSIPGRENSMSQMRRGLPKLTTSKWWVGSGGTQYVS